MLLKHYSVINPRYLFVIINKTFQSLTTEAFLNKLQLFLRLQVAQEQNTSCDSSKQKIS